MHHRLQIPVAIPVVYSRGLIARIMSVGHSALDMTLELNSFVLIYLPSLSQFLLITGSLLGWWLEWWSVGEKRGYSLFCFVLFSPELVSVFISQCLWVL